MRDLRLIGVHDDGEHLVVTDDAGEEYRLRIDDSLRAAARRDRPRLGQLQIAIDNNVRPREVQAMIRAGATPDEVAARTGWDLDKIARFEGPVLAELEHVASRAQVVRLRGTNQAGAPETLGQRAATRLTGRGVDPSSVEWNAFRDAEGQWTVTAVFTAGGRERTATWWFDMAGMSVVAKNDEAKWLSEADAPSGPVPTTVHRPTAVFDVEVEEKSAERATRANTDDLINSMREQSGAKGRRRGGSRRRSRAADAAPPVTEDALPLEPADEYPPAARGTHPEDVDASADAAPVETAYQETSSPEAASVEAAAAPLEEDETVDYAVGNGSPSRGPGVDGASPREGASHDGAPVEDVPVEDTSGASDEESAQTAELPITRAEPVEDDDAAPAEDQDTDEAATSGRGRSKSKGRGRKGRASVPSWDDVMFGTGKD